ncbi:FAD/NAD(P)-binding domain-containing protein [Periconia macrospinosa]|uniref:FAD/NAD(P)-binding domain-containing protein n=1 Tax=Periconia macrospinosa TaxID=97972 RepID=A0A2V1DQ90_9PLEO|nr:FAD/NAD(P)-binding domain-containing protein [Periconia macrospinosa]
MASQFMNIVVLGGSFAGLGVAQAFLDNCIQHLSTFDGAPTYRVVLVSPSTHLYWNICAPRALVSSKLIEPNETCFPIEPAFSRHANANFTFIQGSATKIDISARKVTIELATTQGKERTGSPSHANFMPSRPPPSQRTQHRTQDYRHETIPYHALVNATGSSSHSPLFSLHGTHEKTLEALEDFHRALDRAHSITIVGGGPTGVETAGELAAFYNIPSLQERVPQSMQCCGTYSSNYKPICGELFNSCEKFTELKPNINNRLPASHPTHARTSPSTNLLPKQITLISGGSRLLPRLNPKYATKAEKQLQRLGVSILHYTRQIGRVANTDGTFTCMLNNGPAITSDILIQATGVYPNTSFLPRHMLDEAGYIITDQKTLRVYGHATGERVYAIGDCANCSLNFTVDVYDAIPVLVRNLLNDLLAHEYKIQTTILVPTIQHAPSMQNLSCRRPGGTAESSAIKKERTTSRLFNRFSFTPSKAEPHNTILSPFYMPPTPHPFRKPPTPNTPPHTPLRPLLTPEEFRAKVSALKDAHFKPRLKDYQVMPMGKRRGVGVLGGHNVPSCMVWALKGRGYRLDKMKDAVGKGWNPYGPPGGNRVGDLKMRFGMYGEGRGKRGEKGV